MKVDSALQAYESSHRPEPLWLHKHYNGGDINLTTLHWQWKGHLGSDLPDVSLVQANVLPRFKIVRTLDHLPTISTSPQ